MAMENKKKVYVKTINQMFVERFNVSRQTVERALKGETNSPEARKMRMTYEKVKELIATA